MLATVLVQTGVSYKKAHAQEEVMCPINYDVLVNGLARNLKETDPIVLKEGKPQALYLTG